MRADIAVIGGGIAGLSVAAELSRSARVVVVEAAEFAGSAATGSSAAMVSPAFKPGPIRRLVLAGLPFFRNPPESFGGTAIRHTPGRLVIARDEGRDEMQGRVSADDAGAVSVITFEEARAFCPGLRPGYGGAALYEPDCHEADVHRLISGFVHLIRYNGGEVRLGSPVTALRTDHGRWTLATGRGEVAADMVVNAAGAWADDIATRAGVQPLGIGPTLRSAFTFGVKGFDDVEDWPFVLDEGGYWFKADGPHLMVSLSGGRAVELGEARANHEDVALALDLLEGATVLGGRHVRREWGAFLAYSPDLLPAVGYDTDHPGFFWLAGLGATGIMTAPALGRVAASLIIDGGLGDDLDALKDDVARFSPARFGAA